MISEFQIRVLPEVAFDIDNLKKWLLEEKGIEKISAIRILKRSIDARQRTIFVNLTLRTFINEQPEDLVYTPVQYQDVSDKPSVVPLIA